MANAPLILETAMLLLVAFLVGCVLGALARWLNVRRRRPVASVVAAPSPPPAAPPPVTAPLFARPPGPSAAERRAAAAGRAAGAARPAAPPPDPAPAAPAHTARLPAHVAGQVSALPAAPPPAPGLQAPPPAPVPDAEAAARQAVEGGWTPPRRRDREPFPEAAAPPAIETAAAAPEPIDAAEAATDAGAAMADARSAVAAALAAADAAMVEMAPPEVSGAADSPLPETSAPQAEASPSGRPHRGFGAPELLAAPRDGGKDDLTTVRGITPAGEAALNGLGIFHLDQIAGWDRKAVLWVDNRLGLRGRILRERWPEQARRLAAPAPAVRPRR